MENLTRTYAGAGVDTKEEDVAMSRIKPLFEQTFKNRKGIGESLLPIKHYAAIIKITEEIAVAVKTDGVGTKTLVAQLMDKYDTVGIDCVAMNVNDLLCTGAEPTSFLDYLAIQKSDPDFIEEIGKGLKKGADMAKVNIIGGETAILPDMVKSAKGREGKGFDLAGVGVGTINSSKIIDGSLIEEGDVVIGISSSGIHSNGLTLARDVLFERNHFTVEKRFDELERSLGEELLEPTYIYVNEVLEMLREGITLKSLSHITSHGLHELCRMNGNFGYEINYLPKPQPIYELIQKYGPTDITEMYEVYNMGIGMCAILPREQLDSSLQIAGKYGKKAFFMGKAIKDHDKKIDLKSLKIASINEGRFNRY
jgi:phosphoribosylformylglycinamidine cyclo-ligase